MNLHDAPQSTVPSSDLDDPGAVAEMVVCFYRFVAMDEVLGPMFNDVARVDWSEHIRS